MVDKKREAFFCFKWLTKKEKLFFVSIFLFQMVDKKREAFFVSNAVKILKKPET